MTDKTHKTEISGEITDGLYMTVSLGVSFTDPENPKIKGELLGVVPGGVMLRVEGLKEKGFSQVIFTAQELTKAGMRILDPEVG